MKPSLKLLVLTAVALTSIAVTWTLVSRNPIARGGLGARRVEFRGARFDVLEVSLDRHRVSLHTEGAGRDLKQNLQSLRAAGRSPVALTNAGIFEPGFTPTGLLVVNGAARNPLNTAPGTGNFFLQPNGVFLVGPKGAAVVETSEYPAAGAATDATQSGPLLLRRGAIHPAFNRGSTNLLLRSAVGVREPNTVVFVISRGGVNLWTLAALFRDELNCPDALFLDGDISGLWVDGDEEPGDLLRGPFAAVIVVEPR